MSRNQKNHALFKQFIRQLENAKSTLDLRAKMAARTAAEMLYDESVVQFIIRGHRVENAVLAANELYPSEALEVTPANIDNLERYYRGLERIAFIDYARQKRPAPTNRQRV